MVKYNPSLDFRSSNMIQPGDSLGPYRIIEQVGVGGMATVYKAHHDKLDRDVAIKMMHPAFLEDPTFHARFEREARIVARMEHPNIVPVYDFSEYDKQPYLVMKYIEGETLKARLSRDGVLTLEEILEVMTPVADALSYAHEHGILHRDIKPSNIIIDANGTPYLTDFGLARLAQSGESTMSHDMLVGTPHYISPEQARGGLELDSRTDIYSLGVVLYELVVGRVPYTGVTPYAIIHDHIYSPLPLPSRVNPAIPRAVENVLLKALAKSPADRYGSAREMLDDFREAVRDSGLESLPADRSITAAVSLAKLRDEAYNSQMQTLTDPQAAASVLPAPPVPPAPPAAPLPPRKPKMERPDPEADPAAYAKWQAQDAMEKVRTGLDKALAGGRGEKIANVIDNLGTKLEKKIEEKIDEGKINISVTPDGKWVTDKKDKKAEESYFDDRDDDLSEEAIRHRIEKRFKRRTDFLGHLVSFIGVNVLLWVLWGGFGLTLGIPLPWPLIVMLGWGAGLADDAVNTFYQTGRRDEAREDAIERELVLLYGEDWHDTVTPDQYKKVRRSVSHNFYRRGDFIKNVSVFALINAMLWVIWSSHWPISIDFPWPLVVMLGWSIGLLSDGIKALGGGRSHERERAIEREIGRRRGESLLEKRKNDEDEKRKNDQDDSLQDRAVRLTGDGELTDSFVQEMDDKRQRRRRNR